MAAKLAAMKVATLVDGTVETPAATTDAMLALK